MEKKAHNAVSKWYNLDQFLFICTILTEIIPMIYAPNTVMELAFIWKYYISFVFGTGGK